MDFLEIVAAEKQIIDYAKSQGLSEAIARHQGYLAEIVTTEVCKAFTEWNDGPDRIFSDRLLNALHELVGCPASQGERADSAALAELAQWLKRGIEISDKNIAKQKECDYAPSLGMVEMARATMQDVLNKVEMLTGSQQERGGESTTKVVTGSGGRTHEGAGLGIRCGER